MGDIEKWVAGREEEKLRERLERENKMTNHKKRELLWHKAWEIGHSMGLPEVEYWYNDLVELLK